jgi:hypothetical protein
MVNFQFPDPDPHSQYTDPGPTQQNECGSRWIRIHNTKKNNDAYIFTLLLLELCLSGGGGGGGRVYSLCIQMNKYSKNISCIYCTLYVPYVRLYIVATN